MSTESSGSTQLWNEDLAPTTAAQRTWRWYHFSALWVGMVMCIPAYTLSASLIEGGMSGYQAVLTVFLANAIVLLPMLLIGHAGHPEVEGTMGEAPDQTILVQSPADVDTLELPEHGDGDRDPEHAVQRAGDDLAGIVVSAFKHDFGKDQEMPDAAFARRARELCDASDAALIVDDVRAGFRLTLRGSWDLVGVQPDLSAWSKAIANGHALAAVTGNDRYREAASKLYVTGSFWCSAVSMAAALATLDVLSDGRVDAGLGAGWMHADYEQSGLPFDAASVRIDQATARQTGNGACTFTAQDGATAWGEWECAGYELVGCRGMFKLNGGTARLAGATGEGTMIWRPAAHELKKQLDDAITQRDLYGQTTILFLDEIHRFTKAQQDALLPGVENGWVILIAATTENPSFSVITPLMSRSLLVTLRPLSDDDIARIESEAAQNGKSEYIVEAVVTDAEGTVVATTRATCQLRRK